MRRSVPIAMAASNEGRIAAIFNSVLDCAIVALDQSGRITEWNEGAHRILGWAACEVQGQDVDLLFTPEDQGNRVPGQQMAASLLSGKAADERWYVRKGGERFWASSEMLPLRMPDGSLDGYVNIVRDRTLQHRDAQPAREGEAHLGHDERLETALEGSGAVGLWDYMVEAKRLYCDARFARIYGLDPADVAAGMTLEQHHRHVVADDVAPLLERITAALENGENFLAEYRIEVPGEPLRWVEARGRRISDAAGKPVRFSGTTVDITARKEAEQLKQLLMEELSHRVKNLFAMVQALVFQSLRAADAAMAERLVGRLEALSCAHDMLMQERWTAAPVLVLVQQVLRVADDPERFDLDGPPVQICARAALSLSLLLHELATNATKYGALSVPGGTLRLRWWIDDAQFHLIWEEIGGPPARQPIRSGFGSRLIRMGIAGAHRAELHYEESGLRACFSADLSMVVERPSSS
jgi:PAS domain S-box-containing protein